MGSISFNHLDYGLQKAIMEKFDYNQMMKFEECSSISHSLTKIHTDIKFQMRVSWILVKRGCLVKPGLINMPIEQWRPVKFCVPELTIKDPLTGDLCLKLLPELKSCHKLYCMSQSKMACSRDVFSSFLKKLNVKVMHIRGEGNRCYFMEDMGIKKLVLYDNKNIRSETLFSLKAKHLEIWNSNLTTREVISNFTIYLPLWYRNFHIRIYGNFDASEVCQEFLKLSTQLRSVQVERVNRRNCEETWTVERWDFSVYTCVTVTFIPPNQLIIDCVVKKL